jgi:hypothetical protein
MLNSWLCYRSQAPAMRQGNDRDHRIASADGPPGGIPIAGDPARSIGAPGRESDRFPSSGCGGHQGHDRPTAPPPGRTGRAGQGHAPFKEPTPATPPGDGSRAKSPTWPASTIRPAAGGDSSPCPGHHHRPGPTRPPAAHHPDRPARTGRPTPTVALQSQIGTIWPGSPLQDHRPKTGLESRSQPY